MATRICKTCFEMLEFTSEFWPTKHSKPTGNECRACNSKRVAAYQKARKGIDPEYAKQRNKASYQANKKRYGVDPEYKAKCSAATVAYLKAKRASSKVQRAKDSLAGCLWARKNSANVNAKTMGRLASKLRRTPNWLTAAENLDIRGMYTLASILSKGTGIPYEVDHIAPLNGILVSGLHVPTNLQVVPRTYNRAKGNKFAV